MHLLHIQHACSVKGTDPLSPAGLIIDCGQTFSSVEELVQHTSTAHKVAVVGNSGKGKRKFVEESVTPIIEAMPANIANKHRAIYDGPSRTLSIGQTSKRRR